jgi:CCR4-NOT complex subunit CAF16
MNRPAMDAIEIRGLDFTYPGGEEKVLRSLELRVPVGARCLLLGANGAGKTTLLHLVAGRHMAADAAVRVLGRPAFSDTSLATRVSFIGGPFPLDVDLGVDEILARRTKVEAARRDHLVRVLGVDPRWRMSRVSDGQRRRVQILLGLLGLYELLLLDEVTTDLDVIARADLLAFLRRESEARGATIVYATHVLDGMEAWATHLAYLDHGVMRLMQPLSEVAELEALRKSGSSAPLLRLVEGWLRRNAR